MTDAASLATSKPLLGYLALFAGLYGAYGALSPFLPAYLSERGLGPQEIAAFLAAATAVRMVAGPLAGRLADRIRGAGGVLVVSLTLAAAFNLALLAGRSFGELLALGVAQAAATAPLAPLADALALTAARGGRTFEYGWVRAAGSIAFIAATTMTGFLVQSLGSGASLWACAAAFGIAAVVAAWVALSGHPSPDLDSRCKAQRTEGVLDAAVPLKARMRSVRGAGARQDRRSDAIADEGSHSGGFLALANNLRFRRVVLVAALVVGAHAVHDAFAVIVWRDAGVASGATGLLWSEAVAAEVLVFLWAGPRLLALIGAPGVLSLAALAGALRWAVQGATSWLPALIAIQCLHGLTFAALHLACIALIEDSVPTRLRASALAVYGTFGLGLASALLTLAAGQLFSMVGAWAFWAMSVLSLAALPSALSLRTSD